MVIIVIVAENILARITRNGVIPRFVFGIVLCSCVKYDIGDFSVVYFLTGLKKTETADQGEDHIDNADRKRNDTQRPQRAHDRCGKPDQRAADRGKQPRRDMRCGNRKPVDADR